MTIVFAGGGAIGSLSAGFMALAGEDVLLVDDWEAHVKTIQERGLTLVGARGKHVVHPRATTWQDLDESADSIVFVAVRSQATEQIARNLKPHLTDNSVVVSLQNGQNEELLAEILGPDRVLGALPDYGGRIIEPGVAEMNNPGPVYVGETTGEVTPRVEEVSRLLSMVVPECHVTSNILGRVWFKQVYMTQITMSALVDAPITEVFKSPLYRKMGIALVHEALEVPDALGVELPVDPHFDPALYRSTDPETILRVVDQVGELMAYLVRAEISEPGGHQYGPNGSGIWWDLAVRKQVSETRWLTGEVIRRGAEIGIALPFNERCADMIYEIEEGRRGMHWDNLTELALFMSSGVVKLT